MDANVSKQFIEEFGPEKGMHLFMVILPNLIKDFEKMLKNSKTGQLITEDYRLDDKTGMISLSGFKDKNNKCNITKISVNGRGV